MRVRQTRVTEECPLEDPAMCVDVGCVAARFNLTSDEGVLLDLFKSKKGVRMNCDISSADDASVRWGAIMLRVVDDIAVLMRTRRMFLADESSLTLPVWRSVGAGGAGEAQQATVMQKYLRPLLHGMGYYEHHGYYTVPASAYYGSADAGGPWSATAASELNSFNSVRTEPFRGGALARALAGIRHTQAAKKATPTETTLIYRFAAALARAQEESGADRRLAVFRQAAARDVQPLPYQYWAHSLTAIPSDSSLAAFCERHAEAIDTELVSAPNLASMIALLYERNKLQVSSARGLKASALLLALLMDFFAVWTPSRGRVFKRKDFLYEEGSATLVTKLRSAIGACTQFKIDSEEHTPIIHEAYLL